MKKLMILGAGQFQIPAILRAKNLGLSVITCSYLDNEPGFKIADKYYKISTVDSAAILEVAKRECIDGIMTIASEVSVPTVAYVAEEMGLAGYTRTSAETISNKFLLRNFLRKVGLNTPRYLRTNDLDKVKQFFKELDQAAVIKPLMCSGSKGVSKVDDLGQIESAFIKACELSNQSDNGVLIEAFIKGTEVGGECLICNGEVILMAITRKYLTSNFVPYGHLLPNDVGNELRTSIRSAIEQVISKLGLQFGALNFDMIYDGHDVYIVELGGRLGGNCIPQLMSYHTGNDTIEIAIELALGETEIETVPSLNRPVGTYILHSYRGGSLNYDIGKRIKESFVFDNILDFNYRSKVGDLVEPFNNGSKNLGYLLFKADSQADLIQLFEQIREYNWIEIDT